MTVMVIYLWWRKVHEINGYYVFVAEKRIQAIKEKEKTPKYLESKKVDFK